MTGWMKCVLVTLVALVTAGIMSVPASATSQASPTTETFAASTATKAYAALRREITKERRSGVKNRPATYLPRLTALPARLTAPIDPASTITETGTRLDADGLVTFTAGSNETAACLNLLTGATTAGRCGYLYEQSPRTLTTASRILAESAAWFDQHAEVYRMQARDAALVTLLAVGDLPEDFSATVVDADTDGVADDGAVLIAGPTGCGTLTLPEHDPNGSAYTSTFLPTAC